MERNQAEQLQMQTKKTYEDQKAQLQKEMEDSEHRREQTIEDLRKENASIGKKGDCSLM